MRAIVVDVDVAVSPGVLWEELRHVERHVTWMADAQRIDITSETREGVGTAFTCRTRIGPFVTLDEMTVTAWEDERVMGVSHTGLFTGRGEFRLEETDQGSQLTWREEISFPWWMLGALGAWFARPILRRVWRANLRRLTDRVTPGAPHSR